MISVIDWVQNHNFRFSPWKVRFYLNLHFPTLSQLLNWRNIFTPTCFQFNSKIEGGQPTLYICSAPFYFVFLFCFFQTLFLPYGHGCHGGGRVILNSWCDWNQGQIRISTHYRRKLWNLLLCYFSSTWQKPIPRLSIPMKLSLIHLIFSLPQK